MDLPNAPCVHEHEICHDWNEEEKHGDQDNEPQEPDLSGFDINDPGEVEEDDAALDAELERLIAIRAHTIKCMIRVNKAVTSAAGSSQSHAMAAKALKELQKYQLEHDSMTGQFTENVRNSMEGPVVQNDALVPRCSSDEERSDRSGDEEMVEGGGDIFPDISQYQVYHCDGSDYNVPDPPPDEQSQGGELSQYVESQNDGASPLDASDEKISSVAVIQESDNAGDSHKHIPPAPLASHSSDEGSRLKVHKPLEDRRTSTIPYDHHLDTQVSTVSSCPKSGTLQ